MRSGLRRLRLGRVLLVLVLLIAAFGVYVDFTLDRVAALPADSEVSSSGTNWLIVGSDSRSQPHRRAEGRAGHR